jgi:hypothetical protein
MRKKRRTRVKTEVAKRIQNKRKKRECTEKGEK